MRGWIDNSILHFIMDVMTYPFPTGYARPLDLHVTEDAKEYFMRCYLERRRQLQGKVPDEISDEEFRLFSLEQTIFRSVSYRLLKPRQINAQRFV